MNMDKPENTQQYRTIRKTAPNALLRTSAITMVLLCAAVFICGTASAADIYVPEGGNQTLSKAETEGIVQFEHVKSNLTDAQKKLSTDILQLLDSTFIPEGQNREILEVQMENSGQFLPASSVSPISGGSVADDLVYVYIHLKPPAETQTIEPYVWEITDRDEENHLAVAWVEVKELETLASLDGVRTIRTVMPPMVMAGSVTTEGDAIHRSSDVRTTYSQNGSGVKVGIISDGVNSWTAARDSGDLPADLNVLNNTVGGDEGTAMLEIVHDMVPGADLYFHDCGANTVAFNAAIDALVAAGCNVICDDIGWITEPFFEDGIIASHLTSVLASNDIVYASSAGNAGQKHYQGDYYNISSSTQHDFSRGGTTGYYLYLRMQAGSSVRVVLQWNDQFGSSGNNYDLYLYSYSSSSYVAVSTATQDGDDDPLEWISYTAGDTGDYAIVVNKYSGVGKTLEVFIYPGSGCSVYTNNINATDSIFGHAAVPDAIAAGAIAASDPGNDDIEPFSSQGPVTITYPSPVSRAKPDLCGIDGVTVTGAGGFPSPFYGTSAAAPHIAAIAAQLWSAYPNKTGDEIRTVLYDSAVDLGSAGYDNIYGYGRADALDAFEAVAPCTCGDICVNTTGWWRNNSAFNPNGTPIQAAVVNAAEGDTICVKDGTYTENVDVNKRLTIWSENGSASTIVNASSSSDHVFDITADYVNVGGFTVEKATGNGKAGIHLGSGVNNCNISNNSASNNNVGIYLNNADNNNVSCNWVHNNNQRGFYLYDGSTGNTIAQNNVMSNGVASGDSWHYNFYNDQGDDVTATDNHWGTDNTTLIAESIYDKSDDGSKGTVTYDPFNNSASPCAPIPEAATIVLFSIGLLMLVGYVLRKKN